MPVPENQEQAPSLNGTLVTHDSVLDRASNTEVFSHKITRLRDSGILAFLSLNKIMIIEAYES